MPRTISTIVSKRDLNISDYRWNGIVQASLWMHFHSSVKAWQ